MAGAVTAPLVAAATASPTPTATATAVVIKHAEPVAGAEGIKNVVSARSDTIGNIVDTLDKLAVQVDVYAYTHIYLMVYCVHVLCIKALSSLLKKDSKVYIDVNSRGFNIFASA